MAPDSAVLQDEDRGAPPRVEDGTDPSAGAPPATPTAPPQRLLSTNEFAAVIRNKYNAYHGVPDDVLVHQYLQKFPVYGNRVVDVLQGADQATIPRFGPRTQPPPPPMPQDPAMSMGQQAISAGITAVESPFTGAARIAKGLQESAAFPNEISGQVNEPPQTGPTALQAMSPRQRLQTTAQPAADILGGAMEMGTGPMIAAIALDPVTAIPALGVGMVAAHGAGKLAEAAGAPPAVTEIAANVAGLAAGGIAGHTIASRRGATLKAASDLIDAAAATRATDAATDLAESESRMQAQLADETGLVAGEQGDLTLRRDLARRTDEAATSQASTAFSERIAAEADDQEALGKLYAGFALNEGLRQLADVRRTTGVADRSPFDYVDQAGTIHDAAEGAVTDPSRLLPARQPRAYSAEGPPSADYLGVRGDLAAPPRPIGPLVSDITQALADTPVVSSAPEGGRLVTDPAVDALGSAFEQQLSPPPAPLEPPVRRPPVDPRDPTGMYFVRRPTAENAQRLTTAVTDHLQAMLNEMEAQPYQEGGTIRHANAASGTENDFTGGDMRQSSRVRASGGTPLYDEIQGAAPLNLTKKGAVAAKVRGDRGAVIAAIDRVLTTRDIPNNLAEGAVRLAEDRAEKGTPIPSIWQRANPEDPASAPRLVPGERGAPPEVVGAAGTAGAEPGAPPQGFTGEMPDFLQNLEADATAEGGHDEPTTAGEQQPPLPGAEGVRAQEQPTPAVAEAPYTLEGGTAPDTTTAAGAQPSFWDALKYDAKKLASDTEGSLRLTVGQDDEPGLRRWFSQQRAAYGHEEWFQQGEDALAEGDHRSAYRLAAMASARAQMGALGAAQREEKAAAGTPAGPEATKARQAVEDVVEQTRASHRKQVEAELGMPLPKSVDVSPEGILTFDPGGKGVPALRARATDLTLARSLAGEITDAADPTQIIRMGTSDEVAPQFQMSKQIADQVVREIPDSTISALAELMGYDHLPLVEQRIEIARQYSRSYSIAGGLLGDLGRWTQANEDAFYQAGPVNETGAIGEMGSVGALQASGITDPDGFIRWLGKAATPEQLAAMNFRLPAGYDLKNDAGELTTPAKTYARNWFRKLQRLDEVQTTIDRQIGVDGSALDRALTGVMIAPQLTSKGVGRMAAVNSLTKAALISRPGTAIRNAISQTGRYSAGMIDEALAGTFALASGNSEQAALHFRTLKYLGEGMTRSGTSAMSLFKHPWADGLQATYNYTEAMVRGLPAEDARKTISLLSELPHQEARMMGSLALDGTPPIEAQAKSRYKALAGMQSALDTITQPGVRNTLTLLNRVQEHFFRASVFDGIFRAQLEAKGLDPMVELADDPRGLIQKIGTEEFDRMAGAAVSSALDYTFAADPMPGTAPAILLNAFQKTPVLSFIMQMGVPFPRFNFVSAPRWVWDHTPIAPFTDTILMGISAMRSDTSPIFRGRMFQMLELKRSEQLMLDLDTQIARGQYDAATGLSDFMAAKDAQTQALKVQRGLEARADKSLPLTALQPDLDRVQAEADAAKDRAVQARIKWKQANVRVTNLEQQRSAGKQTIQNLQAVGAAKSPQEYFARAASGTAMALAGWALWEWKQKQSTTPGSPDVQWYELPTAWMPEKMKDATGLTGQSIDMRAYAPEVQHLFMPDVLADVHAHTDWSGFDYTKTADLHYLSDFMKAHYTGKYTSAKFFKDAAAAYLSMSPAAGSARDLLDVITGRSEAGQTFDAATIQDIALTMAGQYLARLSSPLGVVSDVVGQFDPQEAIARIPSEGTPETHSAAAQLLEPTLANIPFARRAIPEKDSAITGQPIASVDPLARQFGGLTKRLQNRVEQEINATGLPYGAAVPRQTGDREFDNVVSKAYAKILEEYLPDVLNNPDYQAMTPELKRDVLAYGVPGESGVFPQLKKAAYQEAIDQLGEQYQDRMQSPEVKAKLERWQQFVDAADAELAPALHAQEDQEHAAGDANDAAEREIGAPPGGIGIP